jgi:hypothetical protein
MAQPPGLVEPAQYEARPPDRMVGPAAVADDAGGCVKVEELLRLLDAVQRFVGLADLRKRPRRAGNRPREMDADMLLSQHRYPLLRDREGLRPFAFCEVEYARGEANRCECCWIGSAS